MPSLPLTGTPNPDHPHPALVPAAALTGMQSAPKKLMAAGCVLVSLQLLLAASRLSSLDSSTQSGLTSGPS